MTRTPARLLLVLAAVATSCATLEQLASGAFQKPTLAYKSAALADVSLSGATLNVVTTVNNPNGVGLSLADLDYRLSIDGHPVATGHPPEGLQIPAHGSADVTLPATFQFANLGQAVATVLARGSAGYKAEGTVGLNTPIGVVRLPVSHEGTFELPEMPGIALGTPRVTAVAIDHATVELPVTLTAKGSYPVPVQALEAAVSIGGTRVGEVSAKDLGTLEPGKPRTVSLPLTIPFSGAFTAAQAIVKGGTVPIALDGQLQSGPAPVPFALKTTAQFRR
ncbi:MAG TPA: LEA type 2 family protein [Myxococcaceae bacterium]|nr:LEA type 2 family protein [Myxococcaceae bacterium]